MKIGVSGAGGQLGKAVVKELVERGAAQEVVAISRTPGVISSSVERRLGDYDQPTTLAAAYRGLSKLLIIPSSDMRPGVRGAQFRAAIDTAIAEGVGEIVLLSSVGTRMAEEPSMFAAYWEGEQHLIRSAPVWTILRMSYYAESFAQLVPMSAASGMLTGLGDGRVSFVSRDDVAAAAAGILLGLGKPGAIYNATGPKALSGAERAQAITAATGKPTHFVAVAEDDLRAGMEAVGVPQPYIQSMVDIEHKFVEGSFDVVTGDVAMLAGRAPRDLAKVLNDQ